MKFVKLAMLILIAGMLIGVGCDIEQEESTRKNKQKGASTHAESVTEYLEKQKEKEKEHARMRREQEIRVKGYQEEIKKKKAEAKRAKEQAQTQARIKVAKKNAEMDRQANDLIVTGIIHSINIDYNEARANLSVWMRMTLNQKRGLVLFFSAYFDAKGSTGRVTILSDRNDTKLATYGSWGGLKIIY